MIFSEFWLCLKFLLFYCIWNILPYFSINLRDFCTFFTNFSAFLHYFIRCLWNLLQFWWHFSIDFLVFLTVFIVSMHFYLNFNKCNDFPPVLWRFKLFLWYRQFQQIFLNNFNIFNRFDDDFQDSILLQNFLNNPKKKL